MALLCGSIDSHCDLWQLSLYLVHVPTCSLWHKWHLILNLPVIQPMLWSKDTGKSVASQYDLTWLCRLIRSTQWSRFSITSSKPLKIRSNCRCLCTYNINNAPFVHRYSSYRGILCNNKYEIILAYVWLDSAQILSVKLKLVMVEHHRLAIMTCCAL